MPLHTHKGKVLKAKKKKMLKQQQSKKSGKKHKGKDC